MPSLVLIVLALFLVTPALAQTATDSGTTTPRERIQEKRQDVRENVTERRQAVRDRLAEKRSALRERLAEKREEASKAAKAGRDAFKSKLATIRDEKKKTIVERTNTRLDEINKRRTDHMAEFLARLETVVGKIESRISKSKKNGKDTSSAESALTTAKTAIETAKKAVETQAGKTYPIEITDEAGLKNVVGTATKTLETDLRATRKAVVDAKQAVQKVMPLLKGIRGVDNVE